MQAKLETSVGCIGCGNMGGAILAGLAEGGAYTLYGYDQDRERLRPLISKGVRAVADINSLVRASSVVIVALKPHLVVPVLREIAPCIKPDALLVSVAAGISLATLREALGGACAVARVMPNTPALVGSGLFALCLDDPALNEAQKKLLVGLFSDIGMIIELPDEKFNAFTAVFGAGPAYVFYMMQGLTQAAITLGFPAADATRLTCELFSGSAKLAQSSAAHTGELLDMVCSAGGVTICGINQLDRTGVKGHLVDAALAAFARGKELEKHD